MTSINQEQTMARLKQKPRKSLGQHFLTDGRVVRRIIKTAELSSDSVVVEVGPGLGVLTTVLAREAGRVVTVEIDEGLASNLAVQFRNSPNVTVTKADARKIDIGVLIPTGEPYKVVANLPYYAASPIIRRFLEASHKPQFMVVMLQREVARNMAATPGKMSILSVATQLYGKPRIISLVPPTAFRPPPKVTSAIVRIDVYPSPALVLDSEARFFRLVKAGFSSPRKQLRNSLRLGLGISAEAAEIMLSLGGIDPTRRAQTLSVPEWGRLYEASLFPSLNGHGDEGKDFVNPPITC